MATPTVLDGLDGLRAAVGRHLGHSDWVDVNQDRIDTFAEATGASAAGVPVADPYLVLALSNMLLPQIVDVHGVSVGVNYGCGAVRFPVPVPVGARLRAAAELTSVEDIPGGVQTTMKITIEMRGSDAPAGVIESLSRYLR